MKKIYIPILLAFLLQDCYVEHGDAPAFPAGVVEGYEPIYAGSEESNIGFEEPRSLEQPGKIFLYANWLLVNERYQGIHVFDNADPKHPIAVGFISIPGNVDLAVRGHVLYADHIGDLVAIDITDWHSPREISRVHQAHWVMNLPPQGGRYFTCVEPSRGTVVGWRLATLTNPTCFH